MFVVTMIVLKNNKDIYYIYIYMFNHRFTYCLIKEIKHLKYNKLKNYKVVKI